MPGSRVPVAFFVDDGAAMIVASTIVPVLTVTPWARRCSVTVSNRAWPRPCSSNRWRNLQTVVSSGTGSCPRSMPTNARIVGESYSASSTAGSERLNQCWRKYIRSMRSNPTGGRPFPAFGYTGSMRPHSSRHGTTRSISVRNCARRVSFVYFSNPLPASVRCERVIATSRSLVMLPVASQHSLRESERLIQKFLSFVNNGASMWLNLATRQQYVVAALKARRRNGREGMRIREYLDSRLAATASVDFVVLGDLNDGPGLDYFEKRYLAHNVTDIILGSAYQPEWMLTHAQHDVPVADRYTAVFDDFVESVPNKKLLLDHILLSPGLVAGSGLRRVAGSGRVHHAEYQAQVSAGGTRRDNRPLDHRPVSVQLHY